MLCPSRRVIRRRRRSSSVALRRFMGLRVASSLGRGLASCDVARKSTEPRGYAKMPIVRAGGVLLCAAAATSLAGCAGSRLSPDAPAGVTLAGAWKLNRAASDDPQKVLERMRAEAFKRMGRRVTAAPRPDVRGGGRRSSPSDDPPLEEDPVPGRGAHG